MPPFLLLLAVISTFVAPVHPEGDAYGSDADNLSQLAPNSRSKLRQAADPIGDITKTKTPNTKMTATTTPAQPDYDLDESEYQDGDDLRAAGASNTTPASSDSGSSSTTQSTSTESSSTTTPSSSSTTEVSSTTAGASSTTSSSSTTTESQSTTTPAPSTTTPSPSTTEPPSTTTPSPSTTTEAPSTTTPAPSTTMAITTTEPSQTVTPDYYEYYYYEYFTDFSGGHMCYARDDAGKGLDVLNDDADRLMVRLQSNATFELDEQEQMLHQFKYLVESYVNVATIAMTESI